jgi:cyclic-di-GMP phosphodiesterase, flagellum assembly factor TipF
VIGLHRGLRMQAASQMLVHTIRNELRRAEQPMAQQFALDDDVPAYNPRYGDAFVVFAVTVLSLAVGVGCLLRLGMPLWAGTVTALAVYTVLLSLHLLVRRALVPVHNAGAEREHGDVWARAGHTSAEAAQDEADAEVPLVGHEPATGSSADEELPPPRPAGPFTFRPSREPTLSAGTGGQGRGAAGQHLPAAQPEMSVELIQDLIKKLADELNTGTPGVRAEKPVAANETEAMIGQSVAALQATARTMSGPHAGLDPLPGETDGPAPPVASWWPTGEPARGGEPGAQPLTAPPAVNPRLAPIAEAVVAERMDVLLEPIHALAEGRARHFEVSVRLRTADGTTLEQAEFSRVAQGSGLMPRIDAARMIRAARVARKLGERGRQGSVLAAVAGESLTDARFIDAAAAEPGTEGGMSLVLGFAQSEVRAFTAGHAEALGALLAAGFTFALEEVTDLDMDFAKLKEMGFTFVELDAPVFLDGLPAANGRVPAADICRHLADFGLSLIVGRIEDDWLLARILGFGVVLGKGTVFGGPRLVKDEVVASPAAAA